MVPTEAVLAMAVDRDCSECENLWCLKRKPILMDNFFRRMTVRLPTPTAALIGAVIGVVYATGLSFFVIPTIELDQACRDSSSVAPRLCFFVNLSPLPMLIGAAMAWASLVGIELWALKYWSDRSLTVFTMSLVATVLALAVLFAATLF
jgi:hypothetical protein